MDRQMGDVELATIDKAIGFYVSHNMHKHCTCKGCGDIRERLRSRPETHTGNGVGGYVVVEDEGVYAFFDPGECPDGSVPPEAHGTCGLFHCPLDEARKLMPDLPWDEAPIREGVEYIADVKVHMLMPGQWPCIPNWHQDFVPRDEETLEERHDLLGPDNPPMLLWLSGPPLTEFRDQGITTVPARTWFEFTQFDEHRGVAATEHGWRTFIRLTPIEVMREGLPHQEIPAPRDQWIRKHTQVYLDAENFKW